MCRCTIFVRWPISSVHHENQCLKVHQTKKKEGERKVQAGLNGPQRVGRFLCCREVHRAP
jgi:hypothetical protein